MKKLIFLILVLFSCEKPSEINDICWTCTTMQGTNVSDVFETCDVLVSTEWNDKRVLKTTWDYSGTYPVSTTKVYITTCKEK